MALENRKKPVFKKIMSKFQNRSEILDISNNKTMDNLRGKFNNTDIFISVFSLQTPDSSTERIYPLYFSFNAADSELVRKSGLEAVYYINDNFSIPEDCLEINVNCSSNEAMEGPAAAEIIILIQPIFFNSHTSPLTSIINYNLAKQMIDEGIVNINIDVYHKEYFIPLPNSIHNGKYVIPVTFKELLNISSQDIISLAQNPRPEDSLIMPHVVPEAVEWFAEILKVAEKEKEYQKKLLNLLLKTGWQIPPCIRRLLWADLSKEQALEACRVISQFYSWINASPNEIWQLFQRIDQRNYIADPHRLRAILNFASENPGFAGCDHKLLSRFCPSGKCFIKELTEECERPYLFEKS